MKLTASDLAKARQHWARNPIDAVKDWFDVTPEPYQAQALLDTFCSGHNRTALKSAHGVGKTCLHAWTGWIFLVTRDLSRVAATAPTFGQLKDVLWPEYAKWHAKMPPQLASQFEISESHIRHKASPKSWFATARTSNRPENLQGFHGQHILIQVDEASAVPGNVFEVIEGALSNAELHGEEALLVLAGNPNFTAGELYNAFTKNKDVYNRITVSGDPETKFDPKIDGECFVSRRVGQKFRDTMAKKYGTVGAVYDVRVRGLFPKQDDKVIISLEWAERAQFLPLPDFDPVANPVQLVMDIARFGGDKTVLGTFRGGHCLSIKTWPKTSGTEVEDIAVEAYNAVKRQGLTPLPIIMDEPGVGGPIIDNVRRRGVPVLAYNGAVSLKGDVDPAEDCRMFLNRRARDWWHARRLFEAGLVHIPEHEDAVAELASVQYDYMNEKIKAESKKDMRKRLGDDASPDIADMIVMGLAPWYTLPEGSNSAILSDDLILGDERPTAQADMELF